MKNPMFWLSVLALEVAACAAPAKVDKPQVQMSRGEKDSAIAASGIPGSGVVGKAIKMADQEAVRQAALDSAAREN